VLEAFRRGEFDQIEIIGQADEKEFFELCLKEKFLDALAEPMPTTRKKEEVPKWFVLAANLSLKLHRENSFYAFERVVRCGGLLSALLPEVASKHFAPQTQQILLECRGFIDGKNITRCKQQWGIDVLLIRETYADQHQDQWALMDTRPVGPSSRDQYGLRTKIEERLALKVFPRPKRFPLALLQRDCRPSGVHPAELHPAAMATVESPTAGSGR
jgi:hypothetical protein